MVFELKKEVAIVACQDFGPCPLFPFLSLPFLGAFYKVWQSFTKKKGCPCK
jgi:hypothetical protein